MNNYMSERNERRTRTYATILAIGLHLSLGGLLYYQMTESSDTKMEKPVKVNVKKAATLPKA